MKASWIRYGRRSGLVRRGAVASGAANASGGGSSGEASTLTSVTPALDMEGAGTVVSMGFGTPDDAAAEPGAAFPPATGVCSTSMPVSAGWKISVEALDTLSSPSSSSSIIGDTVAVPNTALKSASDSASQLVPQRARASA